MSGQGPGEAAAEDGPAYPATRIICTLGPETSSRAAIRDLLRAGMTVARINFSHGNHEEHARTIEGTYVHSF